MFSMRLSCFFVHTKLVTDWLSKYPILHVMTAESTSVDITDSVPQQTGEEPQWNMKARQNQINNPDKLIKLIIRSVILCS